MIRHALPSLLAALLLLPVAVGAQGSPPPPPGLPPGPPPGAPPPPTTAPPAATPPAAVAPAAGTAEHASWPRIITLETGTVLVYQPQLEKLEGMTLTGRSAIAWEPKGKEPTFGVFWFKAIILVDKEAESTDIQSLKVTKFRFPNIDQATEAKAVKLLETELPKWDLALSYPELQAAVAAGMKEAGGATGLKSTPPKLVFAREPTVLLLYDGKPLVRPIPNGTLERAVNTQLFVVRDPAVGKLFLSGGDTWFEAADPMGPWQPVAEPSAAVKEYFARNPPPPPQDDPQEGATVPSVPDKPAAPPRILVATEPTELIVFDGAPNYVPVGGSADLLYVDNADGKVLQVVATNEAYVLVSGRWYKARSLDGPWEAVRPDKLPAAFAAIPESSAVADLRTFVAGTEEASDALADSQIPQTAAVKRDQTIEVTWDGEPKFKPIEGTAMSYGINTPFSVIQEQGTFWVCHQAVWYRAASPKGPWKVSDTRPPSIAQVPPSAPVYSVRYVEIYQTTPQVVYVGYLPGYVGAYPYYGTVVYGTGWYYPPYVSPYVYYPYPATFGVHVGWNPWMGWSVGVSWGSPFFSVGIHFGGPYYRGFYGPAGCRPPYRPPYGYRPPPPGYRPPAGGARPPGARPPVAGGAPGARPTPGGPQASTRPASSNNLYNRPENGSRNVPRDTAAAQRPTQRPAGPSAQPNNVYGDRNGNVYRQNQGGGWEQNTKQGWQGQGQGQGGGAGAGGARPSAGQQPAGGGASRPSASPSPSSRPAPSGLGSDAAARGRSSGASRGGGGGGRGGGRR